MQKKRVTLREVAKAANVTPQTVSRAIRNAPDISAETRKRVLKIAEKLNYVKNSTASSLRYGNSKLIVIIYDHLVNVYFSIMLNYLQDCFKERNYSILMLSVTEHQLDRAAYEFAVSRNAAGIVSFLEPSEEIAELLESFVVPVLLFGRRTDMLSVDCIRTDDEAGGRIAAREFFKEGRKRIVYVGIESAASCTQDRYAGVCKEAKRLGLEQPRILNNSDSFQADFEKLFSNADDLPDAVFCFNDMLAFDVLCLLNKLHVAGVRVIGFDDIQAEVPLPIRLVSIGTDKGAMAKRAVDVLVSRIEKGKGTRVAETFEVFLAENRLP